ncbi:hypothetical protein NL676_033798 [Syzygium grande]|nr:hypothetical protein NL676_033798 [Syzygium grande]
MDFRLAGFDSPLRHPPPPHGRPRRGRQVLQRPHPHLLPRRPGHGGHPGRRQGSSRLLRLRRRHAGLKSGDIKVQVEDDNVLVVSGERKREEEKEGAKYLRMERRVGKFMRKFALPENANTEAVSAVCRDGVLTVTVEKLPRRSRRSQRRSRSRSPESGVAELSYSGSGERVLWGMKNNGRMA